MKKELWDYIRESQKENGIFPYTGEIYLHIAHCVYRMGRVTYYFLTDPYENTQ